MGSLQKNKPSSLHNPEIIYPGRLEDAVIDGKLDKIAYQLAGGVSPDHRSNRFGNLVAMAVDSKQPGSLTALLNAGASPDATNAHGVPAVTLAASLGRIDMAQDLLAHGASLEPPDAHTFNFPVFAAASSGHASMLRWLFEQKAQVDALDHNGRTPLMVAAQLGHADCVRACLTFGADINWQDFLDGFTPPMLALNFTPDTMLALCEHGFDLSCTSHSGDTVVDIANRNPMSPGALIFSAWRLALAEAETLDGTLDAPVVPAMRPARI